MRYRSFSVSCTVAIAAACCQSTFAIESQLIGEVQQLPAEIDRSFPCGSWTDRDSRGYYRVVIASVYGGAGSETYVQRVREPAATGEQKLSLVETVAISQLNNDHSQYSVSAARCVRKGQSFFAELAADYEHDRGNVQHIIRIELKAPYRVTDRRVRGH